MSAVDAFVAPLTNGFRCAGFYNDWREVVRSLLKKIGLALATSALMGAAFVAVAPSPAQAAIAKGRAQLCVHGDYRAQLKWANGAGLLSPYPFILRPGSCMTWDYPTNATQLVVTGFEYGDFPGLIKVYPISGQGFKIATEGSFSEMAWVACNQGC
ncbi:hypothetical protein ACLQ24_10820 [Micromonospora sp. DT4]|uniref:hypothetical protein n=1 Tax=Micromonospora sp. DT4 TaxID=3393438 RepID=UPI003CE8B3CD